MALVSQVVNRALRLLQVIDANQATPARDSQTAMEALNGMVTRWEANGLALGWSNVSAVDDTLPLPDEALEAVTFNLAVRLAAEYPLPQAMPGIADLAKSLLAELRRDRLTSAPITLASDLPRAESGGGWDIVNDVPR